MELVYDSKIDIKLKSIEFLPLVLENVNMENKKKKILSVIYDMVLSTEINVVKKISFIFGNICQKVYFIIFSLKKIIYFFVFLRLKFSNSKNINLFANLSSVYKVIFDNYFLIIMIK